MTRILGTPSLQISLDYLKRENKRNRVARERADGIIHTPFPEATTYPLVDRREGTDRRANKR